MACRSAVSLLRRCASARRATLSAGNITASRGSVLSGRCGFIQQRTQTRTDCLRGLSQLQSALWSRRSGFCTKAEEFSEHEYPPLPEYYFEQEPEKEKKDVYIIQVKGLPWSCTANDLLQFFSECRIRDGMEGIYLAMDRQGMPIGSAFIEMEHEEDVNKALQKDRQYLGPRYVEVSEVSQSEVESILENITQCPSDSCVVQIQGLPFSCTEDDIVDFFSGLDIVEEGVTIVTDHTGRNSGIAFVQFSSQEAATEALQRDRQYIGNRYIKVFLSTKDKVPSKKGMRTDFQQMSHESRDDSNTAYEVTKPDAKPFWEMAGQDPSDNCVVRIRGTPFSCTEVDIVNFFSGLDIVEEGVTVVRDYRGRNRGIAYVQFSSKEAATEALQRNRQYLGNRYIEVFPSTRDEIILTREMNRNVHRQMSHQSERRKAVQMTHTNSRTGFSQSSPLPISYVHIRGLPFNACGQEVVKFFSPLGICKILMECGPDGKPNGHADVFFNYQKDAVAAMSRNRQKIGERYIELFLSSV